MNCAAAFRPSGSEFFRSGRKGFIVPSFMNIGVHAWVMAGVATSSRS